MGCGACMKSNQSQQPIHPQIPTSIILLNLITKYTQAVNYPSSDSSPQTKSQAHPVLSLNQCKILSDLIASTNGQLPDISHNFNIKIKSKTQVQDANAAGTPTSLLTQQQKIIWKCLLLVPSYLQSSYLIIPTFKENIPNQQQKVKESFHQISLDVNRTFPKQLKLNRDNLTLLLRNIVNCLSGIGYTQGMNFYAGFLLLCGFTTEQAYYIAMSLLINPQFFIVHNFSSTFKQIFNCNQILSDSLSQNLSEHLKQMGITEQIYSFSWFLCSYLYTFDPQSCVIIWDYMIKSGTCGYVGGGFLSVLNIAIILMQKIQIKLLICDSPEKVLNLVRNDNLIKLFPPQQISDIVKQVKRRSEKCQNNQDYFKKKKQLQITKFRKQFITKKEFLQNDKELKNALTTKQGYQKYINQVFGFNRDLNQKQKLKKGPIQQVQHVGIPQGLKTQQ